MPPTVADRGTPVVRVGRTIAGTATAHEGGHVHETSAAERLRSLLLQVFLVGLVVIAGLLVFGTVADATTEVEEKLETTTP